MAAGFLRRQVENTVAAPLSASRLAPRQRSGRQLACSTCQHDWFAVVLQHETQGARGVGQRVGTCKLANQGGQAGSLKYALPAWRTDRAAGLRTQGCT